MPLACSRRGANAAKSIPSGYFRTLFDRQMRVVFDLDSSTCFVVEMDVSTTYINGKLEEEFYMLPPDCVEIKLGYCWCPKWLLYGLAQAGCTWNRTLSKRLRKLGLESSNSETCLYVVKEGKNLCFLVVYVNDLIADST